MESQEQTHTKINEFTVLHMHDIVSLKRVVGKKNELT